MPRRCLTWLWFHFQPVQVERAVRTPSSTGPVPGLTEDQVSHRIVFLSLFLIERSKKSSFALYLFSLLKLIRCGGSMLDLFDGREKRVVFYEIQTHKWLKNKQQKN